MKRLLVLFLLSSAAFAQYHYSCPPGCECLSYAEFEAKYGRAYAEADYCGGVRTDCGYDIRYGPKLCLRAPEPPPSEPGSGECTPGQNSPGDHVWRPGGADPWNEMLQLDVYVSPAEAVELRSLVLQAFGTGNDAAGVSAVQAYYDVDGDGVVDEGEPLIGSVDPGYAADDGERALGLRLTIPQDSRRSILVAYVMSGSATPNTTFGFTAKSLQAYGQSSKQRFGLNGLPLNSSIKTVLARPPECTANLTLSIEPATAAPGARVQATVLSNCANLTISVFAGQCGQGVQSCNCTVTAASCGCTFPAPEAPGQFSYYACAVTGDRALKAGPAMLDVEVPPECSSDSACPDDRYCSAGKCLPVLGACGRASGHAWASYECGPEPGCPACPAGMSCENLVCAALPATPPDSAKNQTVPPAPPRQPPDDLPRLFFRYISENPAVVAAALAAAMAAAAVGVWLFRRKPPPVH